MSKIKFLKIRNVKSPKKAQFDAGIDFFVPTFDEDFINQLLDKNSQLFDAENHGDQSYAGGISYAPIGTSGTTLSINSGNTTTVNYNSMADVTQDDEDLIGYDPKKGPYFLLLPHNRVLIPSGFKSRMEDNSRALIAANKSGVATKHGIIFGAQVVDYSYKGEIHISVINTSTKIIKIFQGQKLIQFVETAIFNSDIDIIDNLDGPVGTEETFFEGLEGERGKGGFGSTGE